MRERERERERERKEQQRTETKIRRVMSVKPKEEKGGVVTKVRCCWEI